MFFSVQCASFVNNGPTKEITSSCLCSCTSGCCPAVQKATALEAAHACDNALRLQQQQSFESVSSLGDCFSWVVGTGTLHVALQSLSLKGRSFAQDELTEVVNLYMGMELKIYAPWHLCKFPKRVLRCPGAHSRYLRDSQTGRDSGNHAIQETRTQETTQFRTHEDRRFRKLSDSENCFFTRFRTVSTRLRNRGSGNHAIQETENTRFRKTMRFRKMQARDSGNHAIQETCDSSTRFRKLRFRNQAIRETSSWSIPGSTRLKCPPFKQLQWQRRGGGGGWGGEVRGG